MMISTRGRYALRVMAELAAKDRRDFVPLKEIAQSQEISQKYLESIMTVLAKAGFVDSLHGKGGGYRLSRSAETYTVGEILRLTEGGLAPVRCLEGKENACNRAGICKTLPVWEGLQLRINEYLDGIPLTELL